MNEKALSFARQSQAGTALLDWWRGLERRPGDRAELRRCSCTTDVFFVPAFHRLRLTLLEHGRVRNEKLAVVAAVVAHVKIDMHTRRFAEQMASPKEGKSSVAVSGLRFRRILQVGEDERDALLRAMSRVVRLLGGAANITDLATALYWWNDRTRRDWATLYYTNAPQED
jgi:CRISPR system Cascade subunit CasB